MKRTEGDRGGGPGEGQRERVHRVGRLETPPFASGTPVSLSSATTWSPHPPDGGSLSVTNTHTHTHILSLSAPPRGASHPRPCPCAGARPTPPHPASPPRPFSPRQCPCPPLIAPPLAHRCPNPRARRAELRGAARTAHRLQVGPNDPHPARPLRVPDHYSNRASILACGPVAARCRLARARGGSRPPPMARRLPPRSAAAGKGGWGRVEW